MALWNVGVLKQSLTREIVSSHEVAYKRVVRAAARREAIEKCIPDILKIAEGIDATIKYIAIFCGRKGSVTGAASRLWPARITRDGTLSF